jgi:hypothetical protein
VRLFFLILIFVSFSCAPKKALEKKTISKEDYSSDCEYAYKLLKDNLIFDFADTLYRYNLGYMMQLQFGDYRECFDKLSNMEKMSIIGQYNLETDNGDFKHAVSKELTTNYNEYFYNFGAILGRSFRSKKNILEIPTDAVRNNNFVQSTPNLDSNTYCLKSKLLWSQEIYINEQEGTVLVNKMRYQTILHGHERNKETGESIYCSSSFTKHDIVELFGENYKTRKDTLYYPMLTVPYEDRHGGYPENKGKTMSMIFYKREGHELYSTVFRYM